MSPFMKAPPGGAALEDIRKLPDEIRLPASAR